MKNNCITLFVIALAVSVFGTHASDNPTPPPFNPALAKSAYSATHMNANVTALVGPRGSLKSRYIEPDEVQWKPTGPVNAWTLIYSAPYPNGKRVIWIGGYDRVAKLDAESLEVLSTYAIEGHFFGEDELKQHIATMDKLNDKDFVAYNLNFWEQPIKSTETGYRLLTKDNEFYLSYNAPDGTKYLRVYAEEDTSDPASPIELRRQWKFPESLSTSPIMGLTIIPDGWIVIATSDGILIALSQDFKIYYSLQLPKQRMQDISADYFSAFVRNNIVVDDKGGIYVVTRDNMHRVQWTGKSLSLNDSDGGWSVPYSNKSGFGSGTTPGLMGWGSQEDHLVLAADGETSNNMIAYWRDNIPEDWAGLQGYPRRIAAITPIRFGISEVEQIKVENTPVIYGYSIFVNNGYPVKGLPDQGSQTKQWLAESFYKHVPSYESFGATQLRWDPVERVLRTAWERPDINFVSSGCTVSSTSETLYCWGNRNRKWTLEGLDWHTGASKFHYLLGESQRFNILGGVLIVAPNGSIDCGCAGGLGIVRVMPKKDKVIN